MSIWILLVALVVIFAALGFFLGAVRTAVTIIGLFIGLILARGLSPTAAKILPSIGVKSFSDIWLLSPVAVVVLFGLVFLGISFAIHAQVAKKIKSKNDDLLWLGFVRMNRHMGICVGLLGAIASFFAIGVVVYSVGYATIQLSGDSIPGTVSTINTLRRDMETCGFDRDFAALDKTSPKFYQTADVLGLIYQNPILQSRIN
ncbi:MAG: Colicin production protein, partial [Verrucomicrobiales bacterium]|nr:Colicin production protein [Verrucomicrobiales bacterium]